MQALFEIDADGLLNGLGHPVIACGMGRVMTSSRSVVVTGDGDRDRLESAGAWGDWEMRTWNRRGGVSLRGFERIRVIPNVLENRGWRRLRMIASRT